MHSVSRWISEFEKDTSGAAIIWATMVMMVIVALIGLAIDGARYMNLNSNLQEIADGAALAGAAELDGSADAITRATDAALHYLDNNPKWSDVAKAGVQIASDETYGPKFYQTLGGAPTTNPKVTSYITVNTVDREISLTFSVVSKGYKKAGTAATATAKSSFSVCAPLQSFICNPWESEETTKGSALNWLTKVSSGQMLMLVGGTKGAPGNWGLIEAPAKNGNPHNQAAFWSDEFPSSCPAVDIGSVSQQVDTGNNGPFAAPGMNVRFDNPVNQLTSNAGPIVIDGLKPNTSSSNAGTCANTVDARPAGFKQTNEDSGAAYDSLCGAAAPTGSCPFPRDRTLTNLGGNAWSTSLKGTGANANDLLAYWKNHHTGSSLPQFFDVEQNKYVDATTRWQVYQMENDTANYPSAAFTAASDSREPSTPFCAASKPAKGLSRRKINVAVVDCDYWSINGASNTLPIFTLMAEFFITEPATSDGSIYGELIKTYQVNGQGSNLYHLVQLVK